MLVSEVLDRTLSGYLQAGQTNLPAFDTLASGITNSATSLTTNGLLDYIPNGSIIEIDSELILTGENSATTVPLRERGWRETTAAEHTAGTKIWVDPEWPRVELLNALKAIIGQLYAWGIYQVASTSETVTGATYETLPVGGKEIIALLYNWPGTAGYNVLQPGKEYWQFPQFSPARYTVNGYSGTMTVIYKKDFDTSTFTEASDLDTIGVPTTLQPFLPMAVAGQMLMGREVPRVQLEEIRRYLEADKVPVGSSMQVGSALLQEFKRTAIEAERNRLMSANPPTWEYV